MTTSTKDIKSGVPDTDKPKKKSLSMHDDVPVWYDCCSCEAEPYWIEAMDKMSEDTPEKSLEKSLEKSN